MCERALFGRSEAPLKRKMIPVRKTLVSRPFIVCARKEEKPEHERAKFGQVISLL